jgi:ATP-dependent helicase/nuclease subunit A
MTDGTLGDQAARDRIASSLDETLFVEAGAGSGKTKSLVDRVLALVDAGIPMGRIATITFTEKAAAELRDRVRRALEARRSAPERSAEERDRDRAALDAVDGAAIATLHAFAQRILSEHPIEAALPPDVAVLDEVASEIAFEERWTRFRDALLDDPALERTLLLGFAAGIRLTDLRILAARFGESWDLVADPARFPWTATEPPPVDTGALEDLLAAVLDRRGECSDGGDKLCLHLEEVVAPYLDRLRAAEGEQERLRILQGKQKLTAGRSGLKGNWVDKDAIAGLLVEAERLRCALPGDVAQRCLERLALRVADFTLDAARQRRASGHLEFHDLLVLARDLLRGPAGPEVRRRLRDRYQRLLLDEFQDTDPIQIDLAALIAARPLDGDAPADWDEIDVEPGRLFFVGDPKQSIYRFRRADIGLFLDARDRFGPAVRLTTNFRTTPPVIDWVNHVFGQLIAHEDRSQPDYVPLDPAPTRGTPPDGRPVVVLGREPHADDPKADPLREREAADVAAAVLTARTWQVSRRRGGEETWEDATLGDITILLPARTSLPALEAALEARGIPYRAETSSLVYATREVRELMAAVRALADPTDQLALVTALRSPLFGCGDDDLHRHRRAHGGSWSYLAPLPDAVADDPDADPVAAALRYLRGLAAELAWLSPAELLDRIARERRLYELGHAQRRPRDLWRRLRFVVDQARAWSESEGGTLREYLAWARLQASDTARVAETVLPETDDDSVRIMTIHGSKGLEFPITIVSGLTTASSGFPSRVEVAFPAEGPVALKVGGSIATEAFEAFKPIDEQMGYHERLRLLYVACTRAQDHLVVSLHRRATPAGTGRRATNAELLAGACEGLALDALDADAAPPLPPPAAPEGGDPLPDLLDWEAQRQAALAASSRPRTLGASDVALDPPAPAGQAGRAGDPAGPGDEADEIAAGAAKQARDLELPPWQKGRYGTAIGRAVHAVLQTVDLATGAGLDEAAAAQAAAEGVIGREADVARLARAALDAPSVREAVASPRWRETYVATTVGDRTLEGYVDLLYRTADGLVVVDYKTASTAADLADRVVRYRAQGGAYAAAVAAATGERVVRVVFVFLTPDGVVELDLPDPDGAAAEVRAALGA